MRHALARPFSLSRKREIIFFQENMVKSRGAAYSRVQPMHVRMR